jgi:signal peptidase I
MSATVEAGPRRRLARGVSIAVALCAVLVVVVLGGRYELHRVGSSSMTPTMDPGDLLLVDTRAYDSTPPRGGDLIVFPDPGGWAGTDPSADGSTGDHFVKRVIGVGGDRVECCDADHRLRVNDEVVDEGYLPAGTAGRGPRSIAHVPDGRLWVLGDNRARSLDSRHRMQTPSLGYVPADDVTGRVVLTIPFFGDGEHHEPRSGDAG